MGRASGRLIVVGVAGLAVGATIGCASTDPPVRRGVPEFGEWCGGVLDRCVEVCRPLGVLDFSCAATGGGELVVTCECLDGSRPLED